MGSRRGAWDANDGLVRSGTSWISMGFIGQIDRFEDNGKNIIKFLV